MQVQPTSPFCGRLRGQEQLLQVDGVRCTSKTGEEVGGLLRGAPGSEVRLYVKHAGSQTPPHEQPKAPQDAAADASVTQPQPSLKAPKALSVYCLSN